MGGERWVISVVDAVITVINRAAGGNQAGYKWLSLLSKVAPICLLCFGMLVRNHHLRRQPLI
jgi:hypothetical protein